MRKLFAAGVIGVIILEIALVYFIMPLPGSQRIRSIDAAYLVYGWRWLLRALLWTLVVATAWSAWKVTGWRRWRQANGEAITGSLKGTKLIEVPSRQVTLTQWLSMYPQSLVMQGDPAAADEYAKDYAFERGTSRKKLTGTDTLSWRDKSWVLGVTVNGRSKAYDWNRLRRERVINDDVGGQPVVLALAADTTSFFAFVRPDAQTRFSLRGDSLVADGQVYALSGIGPSGELVRLNVSQEFWHSWRTFQPATERY